MAKTLIVDDSRVDQELASSLLKEAGHDVLVAGDGREALAVVAREAPDIVVSDLQMPEMDGLELVDALRREHPGVPVILMTAHGSEEVAVDALRRGAASYVPKRQFDHLAPTVRDVLAVARAQREEERVRACLVRAEEHYVLESDPAAARALVALFRDQLERRKFADAPGVMQICIALHEALANALHHGNLEVDSTLREQGIDHYDATVLRRCSESPYCDRRLHVSVCFTPDEATWTVRDEGPGFDPSVVPDPRAPENLEKASGRGLMLIHTFMDEVAYSSDGTEIRMKKRRAGAS